MAGHLRDPLPGLYVDSVLEIGGQRGRAIELAEIGGVPCQSGAIPVGAQYPVDAELNDPVAGAAEQLVQRVTFNPELIPQLLWRVHKDMGRQPAAAISRLDVIEANHDNDLVLLPFDWIRARLMLCELALGGRRAYLVVVTRRLMFRLTSETVLVLQTFDPTLQVPNLGLGTGQAGLVLVSASGGVIASCVIHCGPHSKDIRAPAGSSLARQAPRYSPSAAARQNDEAAGESSK